MWRQAVEAAAAPGCFVRVGDVALSAAGRHDELVVMRRGLRGLSAVDVAGAVPVAGRRLQPRAQGRSMRDPRRAFRRRQRHPPRPRHWRTPRFRAASWSRRRWPDTGCPHRCSGPSTSRCRRRRARRQHTALPSAMTLALRRLRQVSGTIARWVAEFDIGRDYLFRAGRNPIPISNAASPGSTCRQRGPHRRGLRCRARATPAPTRR